MCDYSPENSGDFDSISGFKLGEEAGGIMQLQTQLQSAHTNFICFLNHSRNPELINTKIIRKNDIMGRLHSGTQQQKDSIMQ